MKFLFPKQPAFFNYFKQLNECIKEVTVLFGGLADNFSDFEQNWNKAKDIEHRADKIANTILEELNKTFITPLDREDIYALAHKMDEIVDLTENAIQKIYLYQIVEKDESIDEFSKLMASACLNLDNLVAECFKKKIDSKSMNKWITTIHALEDEGDQVFQRALTRIFSTQNDPLMVIKWKDVIEDMENVLDQYKKVSHSIMEVMVKST